MNIPAIAPLALFEDNLSQPRHGKLLHQYLHTLDCLDATQVDAFFGALEQHSRQGHWVALIADYELGQTFEPSVPATTTTVPLARALIFAGCAELDQAALDAWWQTQLANLPAQAREAGLLSLQAERNRDEYARQAQRVLNYIGAGDCYQANLTFPMTGEYFGNPLALYAKLRETQPVKHGGIVFDGQEWLLSRSPELFFERIFEPDGARITCRPMKGTAPRGTSPDEDAANQRDLHASEKNRAENLMIVDLIRNDLGRLAGPGDVHVSRLFEVERYATLFQMTSTVEAHPVTASLADTFRALFPCGSVTGAPKVRAMQIIRELEHGPRGPYCGALGWLAPTGDCSFNVPIRTLRLHVDGSCRLDVGSGIVADSEPGSEYDECLIKARFATRDKLQLIETLRCEKYRPDDNAEPFPLLLWHLQRLARSASSLHFSHDEGAARAALFEHAATLPQGLHRVRLLLSRDGTITISSGLLDALPAAPTLVLSAMRIDPHDPRLQHKTTARSFYDEALKEAMAAGHFDALHLNTRGEVCEGARSNVFIERQGVLLTPPVSCGVLPGVMRAQLLAAGAAREEVLTLADVLNAERIFVGNALRGLVEIRLVGV